MPFEYDAFIVSLNCSIHPYGVHEIESLLLTQETWTEKNNKVLDSANPSANLVMGSMQDAPQGKKKYYNLGNNENYGQGYG